MFFMGPTLSLKPHSAIGSVPPLQTCICLLMAGAAFHWLQASACVLVLLRGNGSEAVVLNE
jgi:hypothetical protein